MKLERSKEWWMKMAAAEGAAPIAAGPLARDPAPIAFPVKNPTLRIHLTKNDCCPECGGEFDTGWECNSCGFDGAPLLPPGYNPLAANPRR